MGCWRMCCRQGPYACPWLGETCAEQRVPTRTMVTVGRDETKPDGTIRSKTLFAYHVTRRASNRASPVISDSRTGLPAGVRRKRERENERHVSAGGKSTWMHARSCTAPLGPSCFLFRQHLSRGLPVAAPHLAVIDLLVQSVAVPN